MSEMTIKSFVQQSIDKYLEKRQNLCKDFTSSKMERIKNTIYKMVMECLETSLPLSIKADPEIYIELTNTIIPDIGNNYNEYLPFKVNLDPETTRRIVEKIKRCRNGETSKIIKSLIKRQIKNLNRKEKLKIKEYGLYNDWKKFVKNRVKKPKQNGS